MPLLWTANITATRCIGITASGNAVLLQCRLGKCCLFRCSYLGFSVCAALHSAVAVNTAAFRWLHPAVGLLAALYSAVVAGVCAALCSAVGV